MPFLTEADERAIVEAIGAAERNTSGEIRVHIEAHSDTPALERAQELFHELGMDQTQTRNGVLFYIGVSDHSFAIIGDKAINDVVEGDFWDCTRDLVIEHFRKGDFRTGLVKGVLRAGERLKTHFPFREGDANELSNEISRS